MSKILGFVSFGIALLAACAYYVVFKPFDFYGGLHILQTSFIQTSSRDQVCNNINYSKAQQLQNKT